MFYYLEACCRYLQADSPALSRDDLVFPSNNFTDSAILWLCHGPARATNAWVMLCFVFFKFIIDEFLLISCKSRTAACIVAL